MCLKSDNCSPFSCVYIDPFILCKHCKPGQDANVPGVHKMLQPVTEEHVCPSQNNFQYAIVLSSEYNEQ